MPGSQRAYSDHAGEFSVSSSSSTTGKLRPNQSNVWLHGNQRYTGVDVPALGLEIICRPTLTGTVVSTTAQQSFT